MSHVKVGYGEKIITPPLGLDLTGYGHHMERKAEGILDDLSVRALVIQSGSEAIVLVTCDLLGFTVDFMDLVRKEIAVKHGLPLGHVLITCTHTHCGPATQHLRGMAKETPSYMSTVSSAIKEAVRLGFIDLKTANLSYRSEKIEPIGFNRRLYTFDPIDPSLKVLICKRRGDKIYLLNYACHPVTLGVAHKVSADFPGGVVRAFEKRGARCLFFQGFCGDINPVAVLNRWGVGAEEDLNFYGELLCQRALKAEKYAIPLENLSIQGIDRRVKLPLAVPTMKVIERDRQALLKTFESQAGPTQFVEEWAASAIDHHARYVKSPFISKVPIHAIALGKMKIIGLPGEVFCGYGLRLQEKVPDLFCFGFSNGNVGYLPSKSAFQVPNDYACCVASKIYHVYPFEKNLEDFVVAEGEKALHRL